MMKNELYIGQKVYWNDPDKNLCSGYKTITAKNNIIILDDGTETTLAELDFAKKESKPKKT